MRRWQALVRVLLPILFCTITCYHCIMPSCKFAWKCWMNVCCNGCWALVEWAISMFVLPAWIIACIWWVTNVLLTSATNNWCALCSVRRLLTIYWCLRNDHSYNELYNQRHGLGQIYSSFHVLIDHCMLRCYYCWYLCCSALLWLLSELWCISSLSHCSVSKSVWYVRKVLIVVFC